MDKETIETLRFYGVSNNSIGMLELDYRNGFIKRQAIVTLIEIVKESYEAGQISTE